MDFSGDGPGGRKETRREERWGDEDTGRGGGGETRGNKWEEKEWCEGKVTKGGGEIGREECRSGNEGRQRRKGEAMRERKEVEEERKRGYEEVEERKEGDKRRKGN